MNYLIRNRICVFGIQLDNVKTLGDPIIDHFDSSPTYGQLDDSATIILSTMAHIEIQMYHTEKDQTQLDPRILYGWFVELIPSQYLRNGITNWVNKELWTKFDCSLCFATGCTRICIHI